MENEKREMNKVQRPFVSSLHQERGWTKSTQTNQTYLLVQFSMLNSFGRRGNIHAKDRHKMHCSNVMKIFSPTFMFRYVLHVLLLPVTACETERANSQFKLLKTYLRSTMSEERLSALAMMKIHREKVKHLKLDCFVTDFVNQRPRTMYI